MGFQSHIHFTKGQCSKGDTESFRHEGPKRGEWTTKAALSPEPRIEKMDKSSRRKSPCGRSSSGKLTRKTCQHDMHGKYTKPSCDFWHPPKCQYYKKQSGYRFGENVLSCTSRLKDSPAESRKSQVIKVLLLYLRIHDSWGCVSRDVEPPKFNSISRKSTTVLRPIHTVQFSKNTQRHTKYSGKQRSIAWCDSTKPVLTSAVRALQNFRIGLWKRLKGKSDAPAETRVLKLKAKDKGSFFSLTDVWCLPAASVIKPKERKFVVDAGA